MFYCAHLKIFRRKSVVSTSGGPCILFLNRRSRISISIVCFQGWYHDSFLNTTCEERKWLYVFNKNEEFVEILTVNSVESVNAKLKMWIMWRQLQLVIQTFRSRSRMTPVGFNKVLKFKKIVLERNVSAEDYHKASNSVQMRLINDTDDLSYNKLPFFHSGRSY